MVTVVFRNTTGYPVTVQFFGNGSGGNQQLYSGAVQGLSGLITLPTGWTNYTCTVTAAPNPSATGMMMKLPPIVQSAKVTVVFQQVSGADQ